MPDRIYSKNDIILQRYVIQQMLGAGNFSYVYKVLDSLSGDVVALKVFKEGTGVLDHLRDEFHILKSLHHPQIARVYDIGQIIDGDYTAYYLKLEYVEGEVLSEIIPRGRISLRKAREIVMDLLDSVGYMHSQHIMHRDIKPNNIITNGRGAVIVDFNISKFVERYASSRVGTPRYMPPEVNLEGWNWTGDLYAVGLVLYEMLTKEYPFPDGHTPLLSEPRDPNEYNHSLSPSLTAAILKAIARNPKDRFQTAQEMQTVLETVDWEPVWRPYKIPTVDLNRIQLTPEESEKNNYNPYLTRLLTLYSQSKYSNAGTRGLDEFGRATYVETRLDKDLKPAILGGGYSLVIITGNAGDGKTAFIQKLEDGIRGHVLTTAYEQLASGNGTHFFYNGREYLTNYDGSQDEGLVNNDEVLKAFFMPYAGDKPIMPSSVTRVIAINEGRLVDFLQSQRDIFPHLYRQVRDFFERNQLAEDQILIVNLNLRSVIADDDQNTSIFDQMIDRLTAPGFWDKCKGCDISDRCYAKFNADSMNDPNYGPQIRQRIKILFQIAHFRQRLHITIRDLRSALAYLLFSTDGCDGIHQLLNDPSGFTDYLSRFFYNAGFDFEQPVRSSSDRLVRLISQVDPGQVSNPKLDAHIAFLPPGEISLMPPFDSRNDYDRLLLETLYKTIQDIGQNRDTDQADDQQVRQSLSRSRYYHAALRRKIYFERVDEHWLEMLPYSQFTAFLGLMTQSETVKMTLARDDLVHAISLSEGIHDDILGKEYLCLKTNQEPKATVKSFRRFHKDHFSCSTRSIGGLSRFLEYVPAVLVLEYHPGENIRMEISLDLYEMLYRIRNGYTPSLNELRGSFINLLIFKRQLASTHYDEVLLTENEKSYFRIYKLPDKKVILTGI